MDGEILRGLIIMLLCCWGCGLLFLGFGVSVYLSKKPVGFLRGTKGKSGCLSDPVRYNRDVGRMWMLYSIPYWLAGLFGFFGLIRSWLVLISPALVLLACTVGVWWLVVSHRRIWNRYFIRQHT